jgi:hypothetical protein
MINEVLDVMVELAQEGMTMMCVTHEMGFARKVANWVIFMDKGQIVEDDSKEAFFGAPCLNGPASSWPRSLQYRAPRPLGARSGTGPGSIPGRDIRPCGVPAGILPSGTFFLSEWP